MRTLDGFRSLQYCIRKCKTSKENQITVYFRAKYKNGKLIWTQKNVTKSGLQLNGFRRKKKTEEVNVQTRGSWWEYRGTAWRWSPPTGTWHRRRWYPWVVCPGSFLSTSWTTSSSPSPASSPCCSLIAKGSLENCRRKTSDGTKSPKTILPLEHYWKERGF